VFESGVEGRLIPLDDAESAARDIIEWLDSPALMARGGEAARNGFIDRFEAGKVAARLHAFLSSSSSD
jgi:glycosyltransferase involved in cell wall biosynthesis